jgi:hypothetical protein
MRSDRRLGFADDPRRTVDDIRDFARWVFLQHIASLAPAVLETLRVLTPQPSAGPCLDGPDETALQAWAASWHLCDPWVLAYATASWRAWRRWPKTPLVWHERDDLAGTLVRRSRWGQRVPRPLKHPEHFSWLVQYQVLGAPYRTPTIREACHRLAQILGLKLRPAERGWARRNQQRKRRQQDTGPQIRH